MQKATSMRITCAAYARYTFYDAEINLAIYLQISSLANHFDADGS